MKKKTYTIRFYRKAWTDIKVKATNKDEAYDLAEEKYNNGDYTEDAEHFENTDSEIISIE